MMKTFSISLQTSSSTKHPRNRSSQATDNIFFFFFSFIEDFLLFSLNTVVSYHTRNYLLKRKGSFGLSAISKILLPHPTHRQTFFFQLPNGKMSQSQYGCCLRPSTPPTTGAGGGDIPEKRLGERMGSLGGCD